MNISKINSVSYVTRNNIGYNVGNDNRVENNNENNLNKNISFGNAINFRIALSKLKGYNGNIQDYLTNVVGKYSKNGGLTEEEIQNLHDKAAKYFVQQEYNNVSGNSFSLGRIIKNFLGL